MSPSHRQRISSTLRSHSRLDFDFAISCRYDEGLEAHPTRKAPTAPELDKERFFHPCAASRAARENAFGWNFRLVGMGFVRLSGWCEVVGSG